MTRRIVVTGGSSGIGRAIAARFAADGSEVWITGRNQAKLDRTASELGVVAIRCDHSQPEDIARLADALPDRLDVVVNAVGANTDGAGGPGAAQDVYDVARAWQEGLKANLLSAVLTTTALLPRVAAGGSIAAIGSEASEMAATSYGAAKAALAAWTAGLSAVVGPRGITVNTVTPNYTEGTDFYPVALPDQMRERLVAAAHTRRAGRPEDVAAAVYFVTGPEARHITAQNLHVSGGAYITR